MRSSLEIARRARAKPRTNRQTRAPPRPRAPRRSRSTPNWYIATIRCDQSTSSLHIAPERRAGRRSPRPGSESRIRPSRSTEPRAANRVDPLMRQRGDPGLEALDLPRNEGAIDERAQSRVLGRLEFEQRMALESRRTGRDAAAARASPDLRGSHMQESGGRNGGRATAPRRRHGAAKHQKPYCSQKNTARLRGSRNRRDRDRRRSRGRADQGRPGASRRRFSATSAPVLSPADRPPRRHRVRRPTLAGRVEHKALGGERLARSARRATAR